MKQTFDGFDESESCFAAMEGSVGDHFVYGLTQSQLLKYFDEFVQADNN